MAVQRIIQHTPYLQNEVSNFVIFLILVLGFQSSKRHSLGHYEQQRNLPIPIFERYLSNCSQQTASLVKDYTSILYSRMSSQQKRNLYDPRDEVSPRFVLINAYHRFYCMYTLYKRTYIKAQREQHTKGSQENPFIENTKGIQIIIYQQSESTLYYLCIEILQMHVT